MKLHSKYFVVRNTGFRIWFIPKFWRFDILRDNGRVIYDIGFLSVYTGE